MTSGADTGALHGIADPIADIHAMADAGRRHQAQDRLRQLIRTETMTADQWHRVGRIYEIIGDWTDAIAAYDRAVVLGRDDEETWVDIAVATHQCHDLERALAACDRALSITPDSAPAMNQKGLVQQDLGNLPEAIKCFEQALEIIPQSPEILNNIGSFHFDAGNLAAAESAFTQALALSNGGFVQAQVNMGNIHMERGLFDQALRWYEKALALAPRFAVAWFNLGMARQELGDPQGAVAAFQQALTLSPGYGDACGQLAYSLRRLCRWRKVAETDAAMDRMTTDALAGRGRIAEQPFISLVRHDDPAFQFQVARAWSRRVGRMSAARPPWVPAADGRLQIGYLAGNFREHPMGYLTAGLFAAHDRRSVAVFGYAFGPDDGSAVRQRIRSGCDRFSDIDGLDPRSAAQQIRNDGIHILVDLMGYTKGNRMAISAWRPAPIQVRYLGLAGTTGADWFDYLIADAVVCPASHASYYSEAFVHMPHTYQVNDAGLTVSGRRWTRREEGLPDDALVCCCFNQTYKIDSTMFDAWMAILHQVPRSVLWLLAGHPVARQAMQLRAREAGIDPVRLIFAQKRVKADHLARLPLADLALDTRTVTGAATTSDALRMGVPVVTLAGRQFAANMSASILSSVGLTELVTPSIDAYVATAVALGRNDSERAGLRERLRREMPTSTLFDTVRFVRNLEWAYREMARRFRQGEAPGIISVPQAPTAGEAP